MEEPNEIAPFWVRVAERMKVLGIPSDSELGRRAKLSNTMLQNYKKGSAVPKKYEVIKDLAKALQTTVETVGSWIPEESRPEVTRPPTQPEQDAPYLSLLHVIATYPPAARLYDEERLGLFRHRFAAGDPGAWFYMREVDAILRARSGTHAAVRTSPVPTSIGAAVDSARDDDE